MQTLKIQDCENKIPIENTAHKISKVMTSFLFGLAHYPSGGTIQAFSAGIAAYLGEAELINTSGLVTSIGCHISNNFLCELTEYFLNKINNN